MYNIGDYVVYGASGVMSVIDIRDEVIADTSRKYYILKSPADNTGSLTFVPCDNEKLVEAMRPLLSPEEIKALVLRADEIPLLDWVEDNRARSEQFKRIIESGDRVRLISLIKSVCKTGERRLAEGKKNFLADESAMHKAEHILYSEISVVFGVTEDSVPELIANLRSEALK